MYQTPNPHLMLPCRCHTSAKAVIVKRLWWALKGACKLRMGPLPLCLRLRRPSRATTVRSRTMQPRPWRRTRYSSPQAENESAGAQRRRRRRSRATPRDVASAAVTRSLVAFGVPVAGRTHARWSGLWFLILDLVALDNRGSARVWCTPTTKLWCRGCDAMAHASGNDRARIMTVMLFVGAPSVRRKF